MSKATTPPAMDSSKSYSARRAFDLVVQNRLESCSVIRPELLHQVTFRDSYLDHIARNHDNSLARVASRKVEHKVDLMRHPEGPTVVSTCVVLSPDDALYLMRTLRAYHEMVHGTVGPVHA
jgi:hypothetical protein